MAEADRGPRVTVPDGFVPFREPSAFLDRIGPLFERQDENGLTFGLYILDHHCNRRGFAHGGLLATLADVTLGKSAEWLSDPPVRLITTGIAIDYMGIAKLGDWVETQADFLRAGREIAFANCWFRIGGKVIARANGQFKVAPER